MENAQQQQQQQMEATAAMVTFASADSSGTK
jgi:hypothetical protein